MSRYTWPSYDLWTTHVVVLARFLWRPTPSGQWRECSQQVNNSRWAAGVHCHQASLGASVEHAPVLPKPGSEGARAFIHRFVSPLLSAAGLPCTQAVVPSPPETEHSGRVSSASSTYHFSLNQCCPVELSLMEMFYNLHCIVRQLLATLKYD